MCETAIISQRIGKIGRRSFDRRLKIASPFFVEKRGEMPRLLNEVDKLCELLHNEFSTITKSDYNAFASELKIVISTLKALYNESQNQLTSKPYNERLRQQISDLEELDHDIKTFRIAAPQNAALQATLSKLSKMDLSKFAG